jgi:prolyl-tRNA editing enzyme YbaK/EbsC (Cys-tRNA(Pro) deacylase)
VHVELPVEARPCAAYAVRRRSRDRRARSGPGGRIRAPSELCLPGKDREFPAGIVIRTYVRTLPRVNRDTDRNATARWSSRAAERGTSEKASATSDTDGVHPATQHVADILIRAGAEGPVVELDQRAATAAAAAAALHCDVGAIANSLIFAALRRDSDGSQLPEEPVLVLTSGAHRVDTARVARLVQADRLRRADPEFVRQHTGQSIGGVAPVGHPTPLRTLVDVDLAAYPVVWAAAGHPHAVFSTTFDELVRLTGGTAAGVATPSPPTTERDERTTG